MILEWIFIAWLLKKALDTIQREATVVLTRKEYERLKREYSHTKLAV